MNKKKLLKIRKQLEGLKLSAHSIKPGTLISIVKQLERVEDPNRGKEPTFVRKTDPLSMTPITIPNHKGKTLKIGTAQSIINSLLDDSDEWEQHLLLLEETPSLLK